MNDAPGKYHLLVSGILFILMGGFLAVLNIVEIIRYEMDGGGTFIFILLANMLLPLFYIYVGLTGVKHCESRFYSSRQMVFASVIVLLLLFNLLFVPGGQIRGGSFFLFIAAFLYGRGANLND